MTDELYKQEILDHAKHPRHFGPLKGATHEARLENTLCGDELTLQLKASKGTIVDAAFTGRGCAITIASASLLTESLVGKSIPAVRKLTRSDIDRLLGVKVGPAREKCAYLSLEALHQTIGKAKSS